MASVMTTRSMAKGVLLSTVILLLAGIGMAQTSAQVAATKEYKRLVNLSAALRKIPSEKQNKEPHRSFLKRNDKDIVYSEPAGEWFVRSERFWDLHKKYKTLAIADQIAWTAAENPLPGECEGYLNCHLFNIRSTLGEYLKLYPKGTHSKQAVQKMVEFLAYMADDAASAQKNYDGPVDASDRAELAKTINEFRSILAKVSHPETAKALSQLKAIEEGFK